MKWLVKNEAELKDHIPEIIKFIPNQGVVLFDGQMGAGKTTLIRNLIEKLSPDSFSGSPTYSLVHQYRSNKGNSIYHFDLYRLEDEVELQDIGFDDYLNDNSLCLIEWPEKSLNFLSEKRIWVYIRVNEENERLIEIKNDN